MLNDGEPYWTELNLKVFFFSMMPQRYQLEFNRSSDRDITDPDFSLDALAAVMQTKKITDDMKETSRRRFEGTDGDQRPQQMRRFNNGGRGWNGCGRWNYNNNWQPNNNWFQRGQGRDFNGNAPSSNNNEEFNDNEEEYGWVKNNGRNFGGRGLDNHNGGQNQGGDFGQGRNNFGRGGFGRGRGNGHDDRNGNNFHGGNNQRQDDNFNGEVDEDNGEEEQQDAHWMDRIDWTH